MLVEGVGAGLRNVVEGNQEQGQATPPTQELTAGLRATGLDELHSAPKKPLVSDSIPLKMPTNVMVPGFKVVRNGFCPSTVSLGDL